MPAVSAEPATLGGAIAAAKARLAGAEVADAVLDARLIVEHFSGTSRLEAIASPGRPLPEAVVAAIEAALVRREAGEPVHRILGFREFYGLKLMLSPATLEPRPDTETLVDAMLPFVRERVRQNGGCRILDLGTGTGALALALLAEAPGATAFATDISVQALATAKLNAERLGLAARFLGIESDWWGKIVGRFDAIVSNPPYIPRAGIEKLAREVCDFDPPAALDGGEDGLHAYRIIAAGADGHLDDGGRLGVEIGVGQASDVAALFASAGFRLAECRRDLGGHDRAMIFMR